MNEVEETMGCLKASIGFHKRQLKKFESAYNEFDNTENNLSDETEGVIISTLQVKCRHHEKQMLALEDYRDEVMKKYNIGE